MHFVPPGRIGSVFAGLFSFDKSVRTESVLAIQHRKIYLVKVILPKFKLRRIINYLKKLTGCILLLGLSYPCMSQKFVHLQNGKVLDGNDQPLILNGVNLGGWLLWEEWIWGGGFRQEKTMMEHFKETAGNDFAIAFRDSFYKCFITEKDIEEIAGMGFNCVRIPFNHAILDHNDNNYVIKDSDFKVLDSVLSWCGKFNIYAIPDMHALPGGQNRLFISVSRQE